MIQKILSWMKKHYIVSLILISAMLGGIFSSSETETQAPVQIQTQEVVENTGTDAWSVEEILESEYKDFFNEAGFNRKLKEKLQEENQTQNIEILRASYFTSDDMTQILVNTYYTLDGVEYASNSKHNIETNEVEDFYANQVQ